MKVAELSGAMLDYLVARASGHLFRSGCLDGLKEIRTNDGAQLLLGYLAIDEMYQNFYTDAEMYSPSVNWSQGGPIIEREEIQLVPRANGEQWAAGIDQCVTGGDTVLIAAMRCYVASKFGDEVPDAE